MIEEQKKFAQVMMYMGNFASVCVGEVEKYVRIPHSLIHKDLVLPWLCVVVVVNYLLWSYQSLVPCNCSKPSFLL